MKTPLDTRGSRANDGRSARLGKKQPDGTHAHRIAHSPGQSAATWPREQTPSVALPYPYDQDLSKVLHGLRRRNPITRRSKQANDPVTAAYLAAAARLIQGHLGPGATRTPTDPDDPDSIERPLLSFLSQRAVAAEVSHNPPPFHRVGRVSTMRERWRHQSDFIADVLRFGLYSWHYPAAHQDEMADARDEIIGGSDPVQAVHRVAYWAMTRLLGTPMFRLGLIAAAEAEGDPAVEMTRLRVRLEERVRFWQGETERARATAAQAAEGTAAWTAGCEQGREDMLSLARTLAQRGIGADHKAPAGLG